MYLQHPMSARRNVRGSGLGGRFVAAAGRTQPASAFNDLILTGWLKSNRGVTFDNSAGWVKSVWVGGVNPAAVFFITGDTSNVVFTGLKLSAPAADFSLTCQNSSLSSSAALQVLTK
jgi:hypothetical protein